MELIRYLFLYSIFFSLLTACSSTQTDSLNISDVYVTDFHSDEPETCRPSDVDLSHKGAADFFKRSKEIDSKILHDHYNFAPCYIEGTLKINNQSCVWTIRAGATGEINCRDKAHIFACDDCEDLFNE